jgi:hypothetical protein
MDLLGSLGTIATNVKNVTLPGVLAAIAFALLLWPPQPFDRIPTVKDNHVDIPSLQLRAKEFANDSTASLGLYRSQLPEACTVKEGSESYTFLSVSSSFTDRAAVAVKNQLILDDADRTLLKCAEEEQALQGVEDQVVANINLLIATRTSERDGLNSLYQKYIQSLSPMRAEFGQRVRDKECDIAALQAHVLNFQRLQKDRTRRVAELQRLEKEITARLADAGRLRPIQKFDDILSGLSTHIVGFLTLVFAWGLVIDPINRALFSFVYVNGFDDEWDLIHPDRDTPGDKASKKWRREQTRNRLFTAVDWIRSSRTMSVIVVLVCIAAAVVTVLIRRPSIVRDTTTIVSLHDPSSGDPGGQAFTISVISPGSLDEPSGTVALLVDGRPLADPSNPLTLPNGTVDTPRYLNTFATGPHKVIAQYSPSASKARCEGCSVFRSSESLPFAFDVSEQSSSDSKDAKRNVKEEAIQANRRKDKNEKNSEGCTEPPDEPASSNLPQTSPQHVVPDLSKPRLLPYWTDFFKCFIVGSLALIAGFFLPGVLRPADPKTTTKADDPGKKGSETPKNEPEAPGKRRLNAFNRSLEGDPTVKLNCEQKLAKEWPKISQPPFAIGQGLMTRSDYEALQNSYYSQSLVSTGVMIPLMLLVFALLVTPQVGLGSSALYLLLGAGEILLLISGVDSRHKYTTELDSLIANAFLKACASNDKATAAKSDKSVADQIADALREAKVYATTNLTLEPGDDAPPPPPPGPAPGSGSGPGAGAGPGSPGSAGPAPKQSAASSDDLQAKSATEILGRLRQVMVDTKTNLKIIPGEVPAPPPAPAPTPGKTDTPPAAGKPGDPSGKTGPK